MTDAQRADEMDLRYVRVYDAANDRTYLRVYKGAVSPKHIELLTSSQAAESGLPIE